MDEVKLTNSIPKLNNSHKQISIQILDQAGESLLTLFTTVNSCLVSQVLCF